MPKFQRIYWSNKFDWKHYAGLYDKYCKLNKSYYEQSSKSLLSNLKLIKNSEVLDLACGTGAMTMQILKKLPHARILGVDLSKEMLEYYRKNVFKQIKKGQISLILGNAEKINRLTDRKFDLIFISSALWDLEVEKTFSSLSKVLKKDGRIIFNLPSLVVGKEKGFIFFIEHFFRQTLNNTMLYRRIKLDYLFNLFKKHNLRLISMKDYSFKMSKKNVSQFFDLLRYRYPFILFPENIPYKVKLKRCTEIFNEAVRYIPADGMSEAGYTFIVKKN